MRILLVGGGVTGSHLAEQFCADGHDLVVVDSNPETLAALEARLDLMTIRGNGADPDILERADVERADLLVAVTDNDETNLLACIFGKARGVDRTVARVAATSYAASRHVDFAKLGVDLIVNQYEEHARDIFNAIRFPGSIEADGLLDDRVLVLGMPVHMDSPLCGRRLRDFADAPWIRALRFFAVVRAGAISAPSGDTLFSVGDGVYFAGQPDGVADFMRWAWPDTRPFQRVVVAGGGELGLQLSRLLERTRLHVTLVERDPDRADFCAENLNRALVVKGDGIDRLTLAGLGDPASLAYVAATGDDEDNIVGCLVADALGVPFTAAQLGKRDLIEAVKKRNLVDRVADANLALVNAILHFVRGKYVRAAARLSLLPGEFTGFRLSPSHPWVGVRICDLALPPGIVLVTLLRQNAVLTPVGNLALAAGDDGVADSTLEARPRLDPFIRA